ncbi:unnamed protein product [Polarella glacialis]|uniref:GPR180/TMEM145 transmembrane domain-containing protein n=1 Tax=Polarella glacialis TaxID=89957 RepID=A0A813FG97_POLGL|nr:unnamed protein product [Polarella glacialis]
MQEAAAALRLLLVSVLLQARCCGSWRTWGVLPSGSSTFAEYAGKFCFDFKPVPNFQEKPKVGTIEVSVDGFYEPQRSSGAPQSDASEGPPCWGPCDSQGHLYLVVFDDEQARWQVARNEWGHMGCEEMLHRATFAIYIDLTMGPFNTTVEVHESIRPRFWYFTFAACGIDVVKPVAFQIHTKNTLQGFQSEFGIDERGGLVLQNLGALAFIGLVAALRHVAKRATGAEALRSRPLLRILLISATCSAAAASCLSLHLAVFAADGYGLAWIQVLGTAALVAAKATLSVLQLLTAKGWALFYSPEELVQRRVMVVTVSGIIIISIACEIHAAYSRDWSTAIYLYESWPGTIILLLNVVLFMEAWRSMRETYRLETSYEVRIFYVSISAASLLYFLTLPITCALASKFNPWVREKYVDRTEVISRFVATAVLGLLLRPSRLDAMVNARMEEGLECLGEPAEDVEEDAAPRRNLHLRKMSEDADACYREASDDVSEHLASVAGLPAE